MTLTTIDLAARIGTEIKADRETLLSGKYASQIRELLIWDNTGVMHRVTPYAFDSGRMMHRTTLVGEEALA